MRYALLLLFTIICSAPSIGAAEDRLLTSIRLENLTPSDSPLQFTPQKIKWRNDKVYLWGMVTNTGSSQHKYVSVSFTALDQNRQFLGRHKWYVDPRDLSGQESGNIDSVFIETEKRLPAIIQFKVSGKTS